MTRATVVVGILLVAAPVGVARPAAQAASAAPQTSVFSAPAAPGQTRRFTGAPTDVDFQGADLRWVLRLLGHDIGRINVVVDPSVPANAKVDLTLTQVPWDEIFDIVCRTNQLKWEVGDNVVRVLSGEVAQKELENAQRDSEAQAEALAKAGIKAESYQLNYAKGADVEKMLNANGVLGKYAKAQFDDRANLLLVTGLPSDFEIAKSLISRLDQPEQQVEIQAQIIQTTREAARALGVQWGFNGQASPALGNTTGAAFPNTVAVGGVAADSTGKVAVGPSGAGSVVNLPATSPTSGIGLSLGSIAGALKLDAALTALEHSGKGKILSTPRVTTQNNITAEITQGTTVPYQAVSNNTVTVMFRDAALKLTVTPHIIAGQNSVVMDVGLENGAPDFAHSVNGNPSIITQKASTKVQVADGVTTVIGGVLISNETSNKDETPGLGRVPLLGLLFRHNDSSSSSQEIMIFITPRIIR